jgi:simple sugar transport system ATP-binding protein
MEVELHQISKRYGSVVANDEASLRVAPGERVAIVGENGAGKSTLMKALSGLVRPDSGEVRVDGRPVRLRSAQDALALGIGMVHQHFLLVPTLTVAENIVLGNEPGWGPGLRRRVMREAVLELAERVGLPVAPDRLVGELSVAGQQRVEILKALYRCGRTPHSMQERHRTGAPIRAARVLILDEPTAVLAPTEAQALREQVLRLAEAGTSILWISHKLPEVMAFAQRVVVMRRGRVVAERRVGETSAAELGRMVMGDALTDLGFRIPELGLGEPEPPIGETPADIRLGQPLLVLQGVTVRDIRGVERLRQVHLEVQTGEIVGIAGVDGNGQAELVDTILGIAPLTAGRILWAERDITGTDLATRRAMGVAHVPEDRQRHGLVLDFTLAENLALGRHRRPPIARGAHLLPAQVRLHAKPLLREFEVNPPDAALPARALSGGNQQKLILAREMGREDAALLIVEQPTRGLDIRATEFVYNRLRAFRRGGGGVLLISTDLDELFALSDRIAVLFSGAVAAQALTSATNRDQVGEWMVGTGIPSFRTPEELGRR